MGCALGLFSQFIDFPRGKSSKSSAYKSLYLSHQPQILRLIHRFSEPGSPGSMDFARPRLNFTGNCPNWHRRLVSSSVLFPLRLSSKSIAPLRSMFALAGFGSRHEPRHANSTFQQTLPPSDNDSAIRPSNPLPSQLRPSPIKPPPRPL